MLSEILKELSNSLSIEPLTINSEGFCSIVIDEKVAIFLQVNSAQEVILYSNLTLNALEDTSLLNQAILEANFFGLGANGFTIGMNPKNQQYIIYRRIYESGLNVERLELLLNQLVIAIEFWQNILNQPEEFLSSYQTQSDSESHITPFNRV
ncbi:type III secretion system chaperone [Algicola sagamiensis]|uniref:type III secretion system chaperone n=1 Tax=Algicola sagamiensis TaxID=163869 RepID=UPI00036E8E7D|nr:type III secretion system chaperone [Algicola sagamiensis]